MSVQSSSVVTISAVADTHFKFDGSKWPPSDIFIHAGDALMVGNRGDHRKFLESLKTLEGKYKECYYVPGNHDRVYEAYNGPEFLELKELREVSLTILDGVTVTSKLTNLTIHGWPWVTNLPLWAFNAEEKQLVRRLKNWEEADIVVAHSPMFGVLDGSHYGVKAYKKWVKKNKPSVYVCGHVHEARGYQKFNGHTNVLNVCYLDRLYRATSSSKPVVFHLNVTRKADKIVNVEYLGHEL